MIDVCGLTLQYPGASGPALNDVNLNVGEGEWVLVTGPTGCGKSTLLNCLNGLLVHESQARLDGEIRLDGSDIRQMALPEICRLAGTVFQNPESQICTSSLESEVAFGLENLAVDRETMRRRIDEALEAVGLDRCETRSTSELSGGQKQRLAIACALAFQPRVLLLDEPLSQLDPLGASQILSVIERLRKHGRLTVILVEHRLDETIAFADRVVVMDKGAIRVDAPVDHALRDLGPYRELGLCVPHLPDLFERKGRPERPVRAGDAPRLEVLPETDNAPSQGSTDAEECCALRGVCFRYGRRGPLVLDGLDLSFRRGVRTALMGSNGSGKTTLLHLLAGLLKPSSGEIAWATGEPPNVGLVLQASDYMLFCETVREEIAFAPLHRGREGEALDATVASTLKRMELEALADRPPFALSRGQRLRTAVGSILSMQPAILMLDEPTTGQDRRQIESMMGGLEALFELIVFCTHDIDTAARHADRVVLLNEGGVVGDGPPEEVLFEEGLLESASVRPSSLHAYARRLGVRALGMESLLSQLR